MTSTAPASPLADIAGGRCGDRLLWPAMFVEWLLAYAYRSIIGLLVTWVIDHDVASCRRQRSARPCPGEPTRRGMGNLMAKSARSPAL